MNDSDWVALVLEYGTIKNQQKLLSQIEQRTKLNRAEISFILLKYEKLTKKLIDIIEDHGCLLPFIHAFVSSSLTDEEKEKSNFFICEVKKTTHLSNGRMDCSKE